MNRRRHKSAAAFDGHTETLQSRLASTVGETLGALTTMLRSNQRTAGSRRAAFGSSLYVNHAEALHERLAATLDETFGALDRHADEMSEHLAECRARSRCGFRRSHRSALAKISTRPRNRRLLRSAIKPMISTSASRKPRNEAINAIATHADRVNEALASRLLMFEETVIGQAGSRRQQHRRACRAVYRDS